MGVAVTQLIYQAGEDYNRWVERVQAYECLQAQQRMAKGESPEQVMEEMTRRIAQKCLHPCFLALNENAANLHNEPDPAEANRRYLDKFGPVADHVLREDDINNKEN